LKAAGRRNGCLERRSLSTDSGRTESGGTDRHSLAITVLRQVAAQERFGCDAINLGLLRTCARAKPKRQQNRLRSPQRHERPLNVIGSCIYDRFGAKL
jgi:hypothetical protein